jgi:hypothetical protein
MILYMVKGRLLIYSAEVSVTGMPSDGKRGNDLGRGRSVFKVAAESGQNAIERGTGASQYLTNRIPNHR